MKCNVQANTQVNVQKHEQTVVILGKVSELTLGYMGITPERQGPRPR